MSNPDLVSRADTAGYEVRHGPSAVPGFTAEATGGALAPLDIAYPSPEGDTIDSSAGPLLDARTNTAAATWALFCGIAFLMLGNGLQGILIGVRSQSAGFSALATGLVMTAYFLGFLAGTRAVQTLLNAVGHIRVFAALASAASVSSLVHALAVEPVGWVAMRFLTGFCFSGLYVVAESWINDLATNKTRGRLMAVYMVVTMGSIAVGQFLLNVADPTGFRLFILSSVLISVSLVPVTLSATSAPPTSVASPMSVRALWNIVPTGLVITYFNGIVAGALLGMGAVYATVQGLSASEVAVFMSAPMVGGVVFQLPVGWLSDMLPRRGVILALALLGVATASTLWLVPPGSVVSVGLMVVLGGVAFPLYSLGIAYTNDWLAAEQVLGASAALVAANGIGAVCGPLITAAVFATVGAEQFFLVMVMSFGLISGYVIFRIATNDAPTVDEQDPYVPFPARGSAQVAKLFLRRRNGRRR